MSEVVFDTKQMGVGLSSGPYRSKELDWPTSGWVEDIRPHLAKAVDAKRDVALATLYRRQGSAPRSPGAQMLFDGEGSIGYFSGGCVEGDVALHATQVLEDGKPRHLKYGIGSPWLDISLRCGGGIEILVERVAWNDPVTAEILQAESRRVPAHWVSDGESARVERGHGLVPFAFQETPFQIKRLYRPSPRLIILGWDPTALAMAKLGVEAQLETYLLRPSGPTEGPTIDGLHYLRNDPLEALEELGVDEWTAFIGATHDSDHDIPACAAALSAHAGYVGLLGASSKAPARLEAIAALGVSSSGLSRLRAPLGNPALGKTPWSIALGAISEVVAALSGEPNLL